jgi:hypothetical protein
MCFIYIVGETAIRITFFYFYFSLLDHLSWGIKVGVILILIIFQNKKKIREKREREKKKHSPQIGHFDIPILLFLYLVCYRTIWFVSMAQYWLLCCTNVQVEKAIL